MQIQANVNIYSHAPYTKVNLFHISKQYFLLHILNISLYQCIENILIFSVCNVNTSFHICEG